VLGDSVHVTLRLFVLHRIGERPALVGPTFPILRAGPRLARVMKIQYLSHLSFPCYASSGLSDCGGKSMESPSSNIDPIGG
jgi:hypothetical protein